MIYIILLSILIITVFIVNFFSVRSLNNGVITKVEIIEQPYIAKCHHEWDYFGKYNGATLKHYQIRKCKNCRIVEYDDFMAHLFYVWVHSEKGNIPNYIEVFVGEDILKTIKLKP